MAGHSGIQLDAVIFGGGGAGLWLLDELRRQGHLALLLEAFALGHGQTIASQGIIHGGLKYSLAGMLSDSTKAIREMPAVWRECLAGAREPRLTSTRLLSEHCHLWRTDTISSRLGMLGARYGLSTVPVKLKADEVPQSLAQCPGEVFRIPEQVIDPRSFLQNLTERNASRILRAGATELREIISDAQGQVRTLRLFDAASSQELSLCPRFIVFSAGAGNETLRERIKLNASAMQRRPLHTVMVRGELPELFGHCVDGAKTRATITTAKDFSGRVVWQVGGQVAEDGVKLEVHALLSHARKELEAILPGANFSRTEWAAYRIDRAEGRTPDGSRPEDVQTLREGNVITAWPTKLALVPRLAKRIVEEVGDPGGFDAFDESLLRDWPRPPVALPPWEQANSWFSYEELKRP